MRFKKRFMFEEIRLPLNKNYGIKQDYGNRLTRLKTSKGSIRERSHMTSAAERGGGFKMLTVADRGGLSLADVNKNTLILTKIVSNQACLSLCVRLLH